MRLLDAASDPGVPYPKWMVLQLDTAEDPRSKVLYPERYKDGGAWKDLRGTRVVRLRGLFVLDKSSWQIAKNLLKQLLANMFDTVPNYQVSMTQ